MNIIPVFSSDTIGRVLDQRNEQPEINVVRKKYIFYGIPDNINTHVQVSSKHKNKVVINNKKFKVRNNKLVRSRKFVSYRLLYELCFSGVPQAFFLDI